MPNKTNDNGLYFYSENPYHGNQLNPWEDFDYEDICAGDMVHKETGECPSVTFNEDGTCTIDSVVMTPEEVDRDYRWRLVYREPNFEFKRNSIGMYCVDILCSF